MAVTSLLGVFSFWYLLFLARWHEVLPSYFHAKEPVESTIFGIYCSKEFGEFGLAADVEIALFAVSRGETFQRARKPLS